MEDWRTSCSLDEDRALIVRTAFEAAREALASEDPASVSGAVDLLRYADTTLAAYCR